MANTSNRVDAFLIPLYTLFTLRRLLMNSQEEYMPNAENTKDPSIYLGIGITQNFLISINCAFKVMLLLENLEGYGLLITLLIQSIWASLPFLVFSCVWVCIFCVFYRSIGNTPGIEKDDGLFP
jgi:hypothetical protein